MNALEQDVEVLDLLDDECDLLSFVGFGSFVGEEVGERPGVHDVFLADVGDDETVGGEDDLGVVIEVELGGGERAREEGREGRERERDACQFFEFRGSSLPPFLPHLPPLKRNLSSKLTCRIS